MRLLDVLQGNKTITFVTLYWTKVLFIFTYMHIHPCTCSYKLACDFTKSGP